MAERELAREMRAIAWAIWRRLPPSPEQRDVDSAARRLVALADAMEGAAC